jgi:hypothetical protein
MRGRRSVSCAAVIACALFAGSCAGGNSGSSTSASSDGPFTGTWSGTFGTGASPFSVTLSQTNSTVVGVAAVTTNGVASGLSINGSASGNVANVAMTYPDGSSAVPKATFTLAGSTLSTQWTGSTGVVVTGSLSPTAAAPTTAGCANPLIGTLNILNTYYIEQNSDMYIQVFNGAGVVIAQGTNQIVQDVLSGPYIMKTFGRAADGKIYTDASWNLCSQSNVQVDACKVNQYKSNSGCVGRPLPHQ